MCLSAELHVIHTRVTHAFHSSMYHYALPKHHAISVMYHLTVRPLIANTVGALLTSSSTVLAAAVRGTALAPLMNSTCAYTMPRSTCHADVISKSCVPLCSITDDSNRHIRVDTVMSDG